jgi:pimeloyl-ACP methyl ester carboxylesterase
MGRNATSRRNILMIAGFGDNASMFDGLRDTALAKSYELLPFDMPGFGAPRLEGETTIDALADCVAEEADRTGAGILLAHSVASIIGSVALRKSSLLDTILSVEGNITADDAYFSGTAADYDDPLAFRTAFLDRLERMAEGSDIVTRYRENVARADPIALWELGRDARRFSQTTHPGEFLLAEGKISYLYDPPNCPESTLDWLRSHPIDKRLLPGASHWPSVDAPALLAAKCIETLDTLL